MEEVESSPKPDFNKEVLKYATPLLRKFIAERCPDLPEEQKREIHQEAALRLWEAYQKLNADDGWKSFVYTHCRGTVLDYLKGGKGFEEESWSIRKDEDHGAVHVGKIRHRIDLVSQEEDDIDIDQVLGLHGKFSELLSNTVQIRWDVLAKMASVDEPLHIFLKFLRGQTLEEIGTVLGHQRTRVGQIIQEFVNRFDDPKLATDPWLEQTIWALGLASRFGLQDCDQSRLRGIPMGQSLTPVDLDNDDPLPPKAEQMALFG